VLESQTPFTIANSVSLIRSTGRIPVVLVEGDDDTRLYRKFFLRPPHVRVLFCGGKPRLLNTLGILTERGVDGVVGICDADFDRVARVQVPENVVLTDHRDAEVTVLFSDSFENVHSELLAGASDGGAMGHAAMRDDIVRRATPVALLRVQNYNQTCVSTLRR